MHRMKHKLPALLLLVFASQAQAQKLLWEAKLDTRFDNREYKSEVNWPQTLFGSRLTPQIGIGWNRDNYIKVGTDLMADFGAKPFSTDPDWIAYYGYETVYRGSHGGQRRFKAYAGVFPREKMQGNYNNAFFSDSVRFYDTNLEGMLLQYNLMGLRMELGLDWNGRKGDGVREKFMVFSSSECMFGRKRMFGLGYNFSMYHYAETAADDEGVVDNVLVQPYGAFYFDRVLPLQKGVLRVGWVQAFQNDRSNVGEYVKPGGAMIELWVGKWDLSLYNACYLGDDLMPYYGRYGNTLYYGEPFFRTENNVYNRLELSWNPVHRRDMNLYVSSVHHYDGRKWNWQQVMQLTVRIDQDMFRKSARKK